ncbi:CoA transferase [Actinomadura madurae]|uniref:CaiB/BaiF CoA transferase family protein n=1 Tax=Actinomadura madurae TaxID=1993 RepID=UPI0020D2429A|nr:CaiB/BaiF CoA-transferase family protein [Actinomadura madurae]MCP9955719.1 CoA transferase [Actinomadura madurae]MCP9972450.1 CoA transferase [Actinomadura madurae]
MIKIEHPDGGDFARGYDTAVRGVSSAFVWLNRGKESVQLDLKTGPGMAALHALLGRADVLVANLSPRVLGELGLTPGALADRHPGLVVCTISGYDPGGAWADRKAYDALIQAETGLMALTGTVDAPAKTGISVADIAAGSVAFTGVLAAIRHRDRTGEALPVHVSLFGALAEWMAYPLYYTDYGGTAPEPMGTAHPTIAPYGAVRCADGERLMIAVQNEREWRRLCEDVLEVPGLLADPGFSSNARRVADRARLDERLAAAFGRHSAAVVIARLDAARIAWSRLNRPTDLARHPELAAPGRWLTTRTPAGAVRTLAPVGTPGGRHADGGAVPELGEHTEAVLAELAETSMEGI